MNHCLLFSIGSITRASGVHRIATHLRNQNWDAEVIDFASFWKLEELKELVRSRFTSSTKFIGFSFIFDKYWTPLLEQFASWIKQSYPDIFIVSGSQGFGAYTSQYIDYYISGYGEYALDALLMYKLSNGKRPIFNLQHNKKVIDAIHYYPAYPMLSPTIIYEDRDFINKEEWLGIEFSRGCKFSCAYCNFPILGVKGDYTRTAESVKVQLEDAYNRFGTTNYYVTDETFNDRTEKITKFADVVQDLSWAPYFTGYIRPDLLISRPRDREELARMNFFGHYYGVESLNNQSAKAVGKGMDTDRLKQGLIECKNYFQTVSGNLYRATIGLIIGLPYDTPQLIDQAIDWFSANWSDQRIVSYVLEIPRDELTRPSKMSLNFKQYGYRLGGADIKVVGSNYLPVII